MTPSISGSETDLFLDADETPMLISSMPTDLDGHDEDTYLLNDALVNPDSIGTDVGTSWDKSFQLAEGKLCPGENQQLWCCPIHNQWVGCIPYNGEPWGICSRKNQHCCSQNFETKDPFDCEKLYPSLFEQIEDILRGIGGPGGGVAPDGGGFFGLPDLS